MYALVCGLVCSLVGLFTVHILIHSNSLQIASRVRDREELRIADSNSEIGNWRLSGQLPLQINQKFDFGGSVHFLILITTSDRGHNKVDEFESLYLTQTSVYLVKHLQRSAGEILNKVGRVTPLFCSTHYENESEGDSFHKELDRLKEIFGQDAFKETSLTNEGTCKILLDMIECLSLALNSYPSVDYILVMEDDFIVTKSFLQVLDSLAHYQRSIIQLHPEITAIAPDEALDNVVVVFYALSMLPTLLALCISRRGLPLQRMAGVLIAGPLLIIALVVISCRSRQNDHFTIEPQSADSVLSAAAIVIPKKFVDIVIKSKVHCESQSKGSFLSKLARDLQYNVALVKPQPVVHIGMYSQLQPDLHNPLLFPH